MLSAALALAGKSSAATKPSTRQWIFLRAFKGPSLFHVPSLALDLDLVVRPSVHTSFRPVEIAEIPQQIDATLAHP
jgi:hypothetical protein